MHDNSWAVVAPDGRFDTNDLEALRGLNWIVPDDPLRALSPEIFMRDYYEPRLLPRLLAGEPLPALRTLGELNRVQPGVKLTGNQPRSVCRGGSGVGWGVAGRGPVRRGSAGDADRRLRFAVVPRPATGRAGGPDPAETAAPNPASPEQTEAWRREHRIDLDAQTGRAIKRFTVRLGSRDREGPVEFTAYAFNEDRVKSETARFTYTAPANPAATRPRAYLLAMGVSLGARGLESEVCCG